MENPYINLKKQRELGEIIGDTFQFVKGNYKIMFRLILKITWTALFLLLVAMGYYFYVLGNASFLSPFQYSFSASPDEVFPFEIITAAFFMLIAVSVYFALLNGTIFGLIKSYVKNRGEILEQEVQDVARTKFWQLWGGGVLAYILIVLGFILCIIPGVYLMVPLSLLLAIIVFQDKDISDSLSECFRLIKDNWWITFATILILVVLFYVIMFILRVPYIIYLMTEIFTTEGTIANPSEVINWFILGLDLIYTLIQYLLFSVMLVATAFIYYNLNEEKNHTGTLETIENLGNEEQ